jgi:phage baseplate assembly protein V
VEIIQNLILRLTELERKFENVVITGQIIEIDPVNPYLVRIGSGDFESGFRPWVTNAAGTVKELRLASLGEKVALISPSGQPETGFVVPAGFCDAFPPSATNPNEYKIVVIGDGAKVHLSSADTLALECTNALTITAGSLSITAPTAIAGEVTQTGGDMTSDGISVQNHKHREQGDGQLVGAPE